MKRKAKKKVVVGGGEELTRSCVETTATVAKCTQSVSVCACVSRLTTCSTIIDIMIALQAVADGNYRFICIDVGSFDKETLMGLHVPTLFNYNL